jgi:hypothetical protein
MLKSIRKLIQGEPEPVPAPEPAVEPEEGAPEPAVEPEEAAPEAVAHPGGFATPWEARIAIAAMSLEELNAYESANQEEIRNVPGILGAVLGRRFRVTIDSGSWTAITPPLDCGVLMMTYLPDVGWKRRIDSADANSEKTILPGVTDVLGIALSQASPRGSTPAPTFHGGVPALYAQTLSGTGTLLVEAIR